MMLFAGHGNGIVIGNSKQSFVVAWDEAQPLSPPFLRLDLTSQVFRIHFMCHSPLFAMVVS